MAMDNNTKESKGRERGFQMCLNPRSDDSAKHPLGEKT